MCAAQSLTLKLRFRLGGVDGAAAAGRGSLRSCGPVPVLTDLR
jgi:hypothetical protein